MNISKFFVQLPAFLFFILATWAGTHVWSGDRINTYRLTPEGGESFTLSIRERSKDGTHILLSEFRPDAGQQEAGQHEAASAAINRRKGVTRLIPDVNHLGISNSHRVIYHPPSSEEIQISPLDPDMRVRERHHKLEGVTIPSVSVLKGLSSSPVKGENKIILALPLPARIPFQSPNLPDSLWLVHGNILQPVVEARDDSTFIVSGNSLIGAMHAHIPPSSTNRELVANKVPVVAVFTYSSADDSVQLREFTAPNFMTITHTDSRETSEHGEDMESFWLQQERYQKQKLRKAKQREYINGLEATEQEILRVEISRRERGGLVSRDMQTRRLYNDYAAFMARLDNEDEAPVSSTPAVDTVNRPRLSNQEYAAYLIRNLGSRGIIYDENSDTVMFAFGGDSASTENTMPEGGDVDTESEPGTADIGSLLNDPNNQQVEQLLEVRPPLSLGFQMGSKP